ncbi:hypothetical protein QJQ45_012791 [Haematococcus lacustris]|nr:hypothetical protein QJQ45_012791 [Haematococcus lacustris]
MAAAAAGNAALQEVADDMINFLARCGPRNQKYPQPGSPKLLKWNKYFAYFNDHFNGIKEASPPEGLKPFASLWDTYKKGTAAGGQQHQHQQQDQRQVTEEEQQQPGGEGVGLSSSKRPRPAEDQALIQSLILKVDIVQDTVNRLESSTGGTLLHGGAVRFPKDKQGMVYQLPTLLPYTGDVYQPHELEQCRLAALAQGLTILQLPQLAIDMAAVVAASILITRVYNHMVFSSVNANSKTQYGTGQRVQVVLAKSDKNSSGDLDTTLQLLSDRKNAAVYRALTAEKKKEVDEAKKVLAQYLTLLQPVLRQLLGRPLNALATIITDPTWQRCLNRKGELVTTLAKQLAQAQAPHTDFLPVGPGMDDGLVFLLALQDFPLVAYMGSHKLSRLAAAHCRRTADGQKQVVEVKDMDALAMTLPHQLGTEVLVKAGQLVLFRGNTVHAGNVGVAGSCCARLYGFGRPDTVADNTTMNTSELGDLYHGLFQPIQDEGIGPKMADWNRRGMAGQGAVEMEEGWMRTGKEMEEGWLRTGKEAGIREPQRDKRVPGFQRVHGEDREEGTNSVGGEGRTTGRDSAETEKRGVNCPLTGKDMMDELSRLLDMRLTKEQMKGVLKLIRRLLANQPDLNLITSFYQLMSLQGVQHANEYEVHVCNAGKDNKANNKYCPGFAYPKIRRSEWLAHKDDKCDYCETPRFHVDKKKGSPQEFTLKPRWSMSLFGWDTVVKNIMERKDVMTWFRRARGVDPPAGSFRASPAWREMQPKLPRSHTQAQVLMVWLPPVLSLSASMESQ